VDSEKLDELIHSHWEYLKGVLVLAGHDGDRIDEIGYHYRSAFHHGYKHGQEEKKATN